MVRIPPLQRGLQAIHGFISAYRPAQGLDQKARRVCSYYLKLSVKKTSNIQHLNFLRQAKDSGVLPKGTLDIKINSCIASPKLLRLGARLETQAFRELITYRIHNIQSSNRSLLNLNSELYSLPRRFVSYTKWLTGEVCRDTNAMLTNIHASKFRRRFQAHNPNLHTLSSQRPPITQPPPSDPNTTHIPLPTEPNVPTHPPISDTPSSNPSRAENPAHPAAPTGLVNLPDWPHPATPTGVVPPPDSPHYATPTAIVNTPDPPHPAAPIGIINPTESPHPGTPIHSTPVSSDNYSPSNLSPVNESSADHVWINLTDVTIPENHSQLLDKGLNYVPYPILSGKTVQQFELALDAWAYRVRWSEWHKSFTTSNSPQFPPHPFDKARNNPPPASTQTENSIASLKMSVLRHVKLHVDKHKSFPQPDVSAINDLKQHPDIEITTTDKTKKFALCNPGYIDTKREELLCDPNTYRLEVRDPTLAIEKDANSLWTRICHRRNFSNHDINTFKSFWSKPAELKVSLKDHKPTFPHCKGRPIQPVQGQATEKLDWIASLILQQLLRFVPTHLASSQDLRRHLQNLQPTLPVDTIHFSLDVVSLYPSCPTTLDEGINHVISFIRLHQHRINMYGLHPIDIADMLDFTFQNTLTRIRDKVYRQTQGIAMGSHSGAAYAILVLNYYEQLALSQLQLQDRLLHAFRYIDDYYVLADNQATKDAFFSLMNNLHPQLQFTIESPNSSGCLHFLDMTVTLINGSFTFKHYQKDTHCGRYLHWTSSHPPRTKINIIRTETTRIIENCNKSLQAATPFLKILESQLLASAYPHHIIRKHISAISSTYSSNTRQTLSRRTPPRTTPSNSEKNLLRIPYIDPILSRLINKEISKLNIPVWLVEHVSPTLQARLTTYNKRSSYGLCSGCPMCDELGLNCSTRFVVYQLTCEKCLEVYIGKTYRPIKLRLKEHNSSVRLGNRRTAAGEHTLDNHSDLIGTGEDPFKRRKILRVLSNRLDLLNAELQEIERRQPAINTQHRR